MKTITIGTFDLLHVGHIELFKKCKELAGDSNFIIGLNTDEFIFKYKKNNVTQMTFHNGFKCWFVRFHY